MKRWIRLKLTLELVSKELNHLLAIMPGVIILQKEKENTFILLIILIVKSLPIELHSKNLLLWPPIYWNKCAITPKWFNSLDTNFMLICLMFEKWVLTTELLNSSEHTWIVFWPHVVILNVSFLPRIMNKFFVKSYPVYTKIWNMMPLSTLMHFHWSRESQKIRTCFDFQNLLHNSDFPKCAWYGNTQF